MNANFTMRMAMGCSILVAVCQSAALAGGMGGHSSGGSSGGSAFRSSSFSAVHSAPVQKIQTLNSNSYKLQNSTLHVTPITTVSKTPITGVFQPTGGTTTTGPVKFPVGGIKLPPNSGIFQPPTGGTTTPPTGGGKFPVGGIKLPPNSGIFQPPTGGTTTPPTGGGSTPPSGGSMPPSCPTGGNCNPGQNCGSNWLWSNPGFFGNWGYGNGYGSSSSATPVVYNNVTTSSPAVVDAATLAPVQSPANAASKLTLKLGESYTIVNDNFGEKSGDLSLQVSGVTLPVRVDQWNAQQITFTVPSVGLDKATDGVFHLAAADHNLAKAVPVTVIAAR